MNTNDQYKILSKEIIKILKENHSDYDFAMIDGLISVYLEPTHVLLNLYYKARQEAFEELVVEKENEKQVLTLTTVEKI